MSGFRYVGNLSGGESRIGSFTVKNADTVAIGEMEILVSNEAAEGTAGADAFIGVALEAVDNTADGKSVQCILDPYAVYAYRDGTAHAAGAQLDLAVGGLALAADSKHDFTVIADNKSNEDTLVIIAPGSHFLHLTG